MSTILSAAYDRVFASSKDLFKAYWSGVTYRGYNLDELEILESCNAEKSSLIDRVAKSMPYTACRLPVDYVRAMVASSLYKNCFLLTPLDAIETLGTLHNSIEDYKLLTTSLSLISIRDRLAKCLGNKDYSAYLSDKVLPRLCGLSTTPTFSTTELLPRDISSADIESYATFLYHIYKATCISSIKKGYSRKLIYDTIKASYSLYLLGGFQLKYDSTHIVLDAPLSLDNTLSACHAVRYLVTRDYYEPLMFTRIGDISDISDASSIPLIIADIHSSYCLEYADTYSKVVRIAGIRRRLLLQDIRYLITSAVYAALFTHRNRWMQGSI